MQVKASSLPISYDFHVMPVNVMVPSHFLPVIW